MEMAKYAAILLFVVGCGAPDLSEDTSHQDSVMGVEEEQDWGVQTSALSSAQSHKQRKPLKVSFNDCTEFAGLTFVPNENVAGLVPSGFELLHLTSESEAVVVVRVADCNSVRVKNGKARAGTVAQVGVTLAGPDDTSDINNYTLWYVTDNRDLARELSKMGVPAEYSDDIGYHFSGGNGSGQFDITVSADEAPDFEVSGTATAPTDPAVPFVASWWYETCHGRVQMRTELPEIQFGASAMTLNALESDLEEVVGDSPVGFPGLDSYNTFQNAEMVVTVD